MCIFYQRYTLADGGQSIYHTVFKSDQEITCADETKGYLLIYCVHGAIEAFDERFHIKLKNQSFHCVEYANSSEYKIFYYFTKQFYDEPFVGIQVADFSNGIRSIFC